MSYVSLADGLGALGGCGCGCGGRCGCASGRHGSAPRFGQHYERDDSPADVGSYDVGYSRFADESSPPPMRIPSPAEVARRIVPLEPETMDERIQRILRTKVPTRPRRSFSEMFWQKVNERLDSTMSRHGVPAKWRPYVRKAVRAAIEKGSSAVLDHALDQTPLGSSTKQAIRGTLRGLSDVKLDGWHLGDPPSDPPFRFDCPGENAPTTAARRLQLQRALAEAISLAKAAADALDANPRAPAVVQLFVELFGHDPTLPVPWANNEQSAATLVKRYRAVARHLTTSNILFKCVDCPESTTLVCPVDAPTKACPLSARVRGPSTIELCLRFWVQPPHWRAGIILHMALHQYFGAFFRHSPASKERRRDNAFCYVSFALKLAKIAPDLCDVCKCLRRPP